MPEKKKKIIGFSIMFGIIILLVFTIAFLNKEWDMIQMKRGKDAPIMWETSYATDNVLLIEQDDKKFDALNVEITDLYYLPKLERIHFGLWYDSSDYKEEETAFSVFKIQLKDGQGNTYAKESFGFGSDGIFGQFQRREISEIQLNNIEELYMEIYPVTEEDGEIVEHNPETKLIYSNMMEPLPEYNHHLYNN